MILNKSIVNVLRSIKQTGLPTKNNQIITENIYAKKFRQAAIELCPNDEERMNIILDITYGYKGNRQFCWDCIGDLLIKRLEEMENENVYTE